jgi:hypothetical protein
MSLPESLLGGSYTKSDKESSSGSFSLELPVEADFPLACAGPDGFNLGVKFVREDT